MRAGSPQNSQRIGDGGTMTRSAACPLRAPLCRRAGRSAGCAITATTLGVAIASGTGCARSRNADPEVASRSIHECAHLLGLQLANKLPSETILLTGMQKTTTTEDVVQTFRAFGPVADAAVASSQRGFGLVRFKTQKAIAEAMQQFRTSEVVVKDVAITLRQL